jgi:hypothetical protein
MHQALLPKGGGECLKPPLMDNSGVMQPSPAPSTKGRLLLFLCPSISPKWLPRCLREGRGTDGTAYTAPHPLAAKHCDRRRPLYTSPPGQGP